VITGLALVLTVYVMAPTGQKMYEALGPALRAEMGNMTDREKGRGREREKETAAAAAADLAGADTLEQLVEAGDRVKEPLREFLLKHADRRDRATFFGLAQRMRAAADRAAVSDRDLGVVVPAFVTSELRRAFEIGFLLFIPFLVVDLVIANLLLALGMHMLAPTTVSLPFKLLLFVLADGWHLVARGLVQSYI
jgi:type III secretion protein R